MFSANGPTSVTLRRRHLPGYSKSVFILAAAVALLSQPVCAQLQPLGLAEAETLALAAEPGRRALLARRDALSARAVAAGELPDPMLRIGINNYPIESGGFATEAMTNAGLGIRQEFPPGQTRSLSRGMLEWSANESSFAADARGRDVLAAVRESWFAAWYRDRAWALASETRPLFEDLVAIARSLYGVGKNSQQDVLRAELELSRLDDRLLEMRRERARARAALREWIGPDADRPLPDALPLLENPPPLGAMAEALAAHPALAAIEARIEARAAGVHLAEERAKPGWALDLGYSYREGSLPSGEPRSDFVSLNVSVGLPFFRRTAVDSTLTAALAERSAAEAELERMRRMLDSRLAAEYATWQELAARLALYERNIMPQAEGHAEASILAYRNDRADFADVMRANIDLLNIRVERLRLGFERAKSHAVLANLGGVGQ